MTPRDALLADLNPPQREAVQHVDGPLLVLAGPGSGKTRVITRRAAWLVHSGIAPHRILAITFTNRAAGEMRHRIEELGVARGMWVCTFHSLGVRLLREFGALAGVAPGFSIYDDADQLRVVNEAMKLCHVSPSLHRPDTIQWRISGAKNQLLGPREYRDTVRYGDARTAATVYEAYQELLTRGNAVDFDDLLMKPALVLRDHADLCERLNIRFNYLLVDEYQDTNFAQYMIAHLLSQHHGNLCVTGDPDQSIYGWRGADIGNILRFEQDHRNARIIRLEQNYRSTPEVLRVADALISRNTQRKEKGLWTANPAGQPVRLRVFDSDIHEAEEVAQLIAAQLRSGRTPADCAILYRVNALSRLLEESLRRRAIPFRIARGVEFYARREIKDTLAYLRLVVNPADGVALARVINTPPRGIGSATFERLSRAAEESARPLLDVMRDAGSVPGLRGAAAGRVRRFVELLDSLMPLRDETAPRAVAGVLERSGLEAALVEERESGGEDRLANVRELVSAAEVYAQEAEVPGPEGFLAHISLVSDQDAVDAEAGAVMLMTLHTAKGLEFPVVFLTGLEQSLVPHERALRGESDLEEERRLCFVGMTRAREELHLSYARRRLVRGRLTDRARSHFLREIPAGMIEETVYGEPDQAEARRARFAAVLEPWETGDDAPARGSEGVSRQEDAAAADADFSEKPVARSADSRRATARKPRRRWGEDQDEPAYSLNDPTLPPAEVDAPGPFADWVTGMLVRHPEYGAGQLLWIQPAPGRTRAAIRFAGRGEVTVILEFANITRL